MYPYPAKVENMVSS